jgi:hypothetical protein
MNNVAISGADGADTLLSALEAQLRVRQSAHDLVVVGGSALLALGFVDRPTRDIDVVAMRDADGLVAMTHLPPDLADAAGKVARDFALPEDWLNTGPARLLDFGLPDGFLARGTTRRYGPALSVMYAARYDQIHFKLYAMVDQGVGKHERDLRALNPTPEELVAAARWTRTHDPSPGYRDMLLNALAYLGVSDADVGGA